VFKKFSNNIEEIKKNPRELVSLLYENQSIGKRYDIQNRLFFIHMSQIDSSIKHLNEVKIRFSEKKEKIKLIVQKLKEVYKIPFRGFHKKKQKYVDCYATIVLFNETINGELECYLISDKNQ